MDNKAIEGMERIDLNLIEFCIHKFNYFEYLFINNI